MARFPLGNGMVFSGAVQRIKKYSYFFTVGSKLTLKLCSAGARTWRNILYRLQVWNLSPVGGQIMRAADCENLSESPEGVFRQSQQPSTGGLLLDGFESLPYNAEKTNHKRGWHWGRDEGFDCPFPAGKRYGVFRGPPRKSSPPPEGCC